MTHRPRVAQQAGVANGPPSPRTDKSGSDQAPGDGLAKRDDGSRCPDPLALPTPEVGTTGVRSFASFVALPAFPRADRPGGARANQLKCRDCPDI